MDFLWDFFGFPLGQASDRNEHFSLQAVGKLFPVVTKAKQSGITKSEKKQGK